jgi:hypothetical protein
MYIHAQGHKRTHAWILFQLNLIRHALVSNASVYLFLPRLHPFVSLLLSLDCAGYRNKPALIKARNRHVDLVIYIQASFITTGWHYESLCSKECEHQKFSSQSRVWVQDVMGSSLGSSQMSLLRW